MAGQSACDQTAPVNLSRTDSAAQPASESTPKDASGTQKTKANTLARQKSSLSKKVSFTDTFRDSLICRKNGCALTRPS